MRLNERDTDPLDVPPEVLQGFRSAGVHRSCQGAKDRRDWGFVVLCPDSARRPA
ncbi:MAG: hypothetical protein Q8Q14_03360 [Gemmatimonadales bacterium]|nr:hypothetical protein [Gemmatimonadales bacterium]